MKTSVHGREAACTDSKLSADGHAPHIFRSITLPLAEHKRNIRWMGTSLHQVKMIGGHKTPYTSFLLGNREIKENDCVEIDPAPGESKARIARIEALWSETPQDGEERMLARIRRFYRPGVCNRLSPALQFCPSFNILCLSRY